MVCCICVCVCLWNKHTPKKDDNDDRMTKHHPEIRVFKLFKPIVASEFRANSKFNFQFDERIVSTENLHPGRRVPIHCTEITVLDLSYIISGGSIPQNTL